MSFYHLNYSNSIFYGAEMDEEMKEAWRFKQLRWREEEDKRREEERKRREAEIRAWEKEKEKEEKARRKAEKAERKLTKAELEETERKQQSIRDLEFLGGEFTDNYDFQHTEKYEGKLEEYLESEEAHYYQKKTEFVDHPVEEDKRAREAEVQKAKGDFTKSETPVLEREFQKETERKEAYMSVRDTLRARIEELREETEKSEGEEREQKADELKRTQDALASVDELITDQNKTVDEKKAAYLIEKQKDEMQEKIIRKAELKHDGLISISELIQYESMIRRRGKSDVSEVQRFRRRVSDMMLVDKNFSAMMSEYSPEFKKLAEQAKEEKKNLKWKANVSGFSKVIHSVGSEAREKAREKLRLLKIAKNEHYRAGFELSREEDKAFSPAEKKIFLEMRKLSGLGAAFAKRAAYTVSNEGEAVQKGMRALNLSLDDMACFTQFQTTVEKPELLDDPNRYFVELAGQANYPTAWTKLSDNCHVVLQACGKEEGADKSQEEAAFQAITNDIDTFQQTIVASSLGEKLVNGKDLDYKTAVSDGTAANLVLQQSEGMLHIMDLMKAGPVYKRAGKTYQEKLDQNLRFLIGLRKCIDAHNENRVAWFAYRMAGEKEREEMVSAYYSEDQAAWTEFAKSFCRGHGLTPSDLPGIPQKVKPLSAFVLR